MKNWKTTLAGLLGGIAAAIGPQIIARAQGNKDAPPITAGNVGAGIAIAVLGYLAQDAAAKQAQIPAPPAS